MKDNVKSTYLLMLFGRGVTPLIHGYAIRDEILFESKALSIDFISNHIAPGIKFGGKISLFCERGLVTGCTIDSGVDIIADGFRIT